MDLSRVSFLLFRRMAQRWNFKAYEEEVRAVVERQYLPKLPVPVQHMEIFYHSVAEPDRDVLKLLIQGHRQILQADNSGENG